MKIKFDIEVTPQELRAFLGLPDVEPLQQRLMEQIEEQMQAGTAGFDPLSLMKPFLPGNLQTFDGMQKAFWDAVKASSPKPKGD
jgi:hypothetical protein